MYQYDKSYDSFSSSKNQNKPVVILYSQIGTEDFQKFHSELAKLDSIEYILRHNYLPNLNDKVGLSGYGVELDIKKTEYKAKDDTKVNEQADDLKAQQSQSKSEEPVQGFLFETLKNKHPQYKNDLDEYRKYLIESTMELAPLKAWQMQDLSLQAAQLILDAEPTEALNVLEDVSQNYPIRARGLSKIQVTKETRKAFKSQRNIIESSLNLESGAGAFYLNGLDMNIETVDIFSMSASLRKESKLIEGMFKIGLNAEQLRDLIYLDTSSKATDYGVDIRDSSIQWVNNLEKDSRYSGWSKSAHDILRPTYPGMLRSIAKNFFNLVFVIDPAKEESQSLLKTAESFYVNDVPVRIGQWFSLKYYFLTELDKSNENLNRVYDK